MCYYIPFYFPGGSKEASTGAHLLVTVQWIIRHPSHDRYSAMNTQEEQGRVTMLVRERQMTRMCQLRSSVFILHAVMTLGVTLICNLATATDNDCGLESKFSGSAISLVR